MERPRKRKLARAILNLSSSLIESGELRQLNARAWAGDQGTTLVPGEMPIV